MVNAVSPQAGAAYFVPCHTSLGFLSRFKTILDVACFLRRIALHSLDEVPRSLFSPSVCSKNPVELKPFQGSFLCEGWPRFRMFEKVDARQAHSPLIFNDSSFALQTNRQLGLLNGGHYSLNICYTKLQNSFSIFQSLINQDG